MRRPDDARDLEYQSDEFLSRSHSRRGDIDSVPIEHVQFDFEKQNIYPSARSCTNTQHRRFGRLRCAG